MKKLTKHEKARLNLNNNKDFYVVFTDNAKNHEGVFKVNEQTFSTVRAGSTKDSLGNNHDYLVLERK